MNIKLCHTTDRSNVVNKTVVTQQTLSNAKFLEPYDEYAPVVKLRGKVNFDNVNYCVVEDTNQTDGFTRAYFVESVTIKSPQIALLKLRMDVLVTFKDYILNMRAYLARSESDGNLYLPDGRQTLVYNEVEKLTFRDTNDNVQGFVIPGESWEDQARFGTYVISTMQREWGSHT